MKKTWSPACNSRWGEKSRQSLGWDGGGGTQGEVTAVAFSTPSTFSKESPNCDLFRTGTEKVICSSKYLSRIRSTGDHLLSYFNGLPVPNSKHERCQHGQIWGLNRSRLALLPPIALKVLNSTPAVDFPSFYCKKICKVLFNII